MAAGNTTLQNTAVADVSSKGEFVRKESGFRSWVGEPGGEHPAAAGRYHLYVSHACPWANRCVAVLHMKGLTGCIGLSVVHPTWQRTRPDDPDDGHCGWAFAADGEALVPPSGHREISVAGCGPDELNGARFVRDLYEKVGAPKGTRFTVPVLWDKEAGTIVNNESSEVLRMLNSRFNDFATNPGLDLYPEALRPAIDAVNEWVYPSINNGVYRCGFATQQGAYDEAVEELFGALERCEDILSKQRYIAGDVLTEADVRLFMTLIRFDEVYVVYFKTNCKCLREYPNIFNYLKDMYQTPGIAASVNMEHIKVHYFTSHPGLNQFSIVPKGPNIDYTSPHDRATKFAA